MQIAPSRRTDWGVKMRIADQYHHQAGEYLGLAHSLREWNRGVEPVEYLLRIAGEQRGVEDPRFDRVDPDAHVHQVARLAGLCR